MAKVSYGYEFIKIFSHISKPKQKLGTLFACKFLKQEFAYQVLKQYILKDLK